MRILVVHNRYRQAGGEDTVVANEMELLRAAGHVVRLHEAVNVDPHTLPEKAKQAFRLYHNRRERDRLRQAIQELQPDVVHFHNTFLTLGSSVFSVPQSMGIPSCLTAHNYRIFCIAGTAFRDGSVCTKCCGTSALSGVRYSCYNDNRTQSIALASSLQFHKWRGTLDHLDAIACLNPAQKGLLALHGISDKKLVLKPNFTASADTSPVKHRSRILFLGRLSQEKGVSGLQEAYQPNVHLPLDIVGQGPFAPGLDEWAQHYPTVSRHGYLEPSALDAIWARAKFLVFPSAWLEPQGMVVLEALARGIPVIADPTRAVGVTTAIAAGISYGEDETLGDALTQASRLDDQAYANMASKARLVHRRHFSREAGLRGLMELYDTTIANHGARNR